MKNLHIPNMGIRKSLREMGRNARVDWVLICIATFAIAIGLGAFSLKVYLDMVGGKLGGNTEVSHDSKTFNQSDFDKVVKMISDKEEALSKIKSSYNGLRDPSI